MNKKNGKKQTVPVKRHEWSTTASVTIDSAGRILIPSTIRKRLGVESGDNLSLIVEEDTIKIVQVDYAIDTVQRIAKMKKSKRPSIREFLENRQ